MLRNHASFILLALFLPLLVLTACSASGNALKVIDKSAEQDGVVVRLVEASAHDVKTSLDFIELSTKVEIENTSNEPVTQVTYTIKLIGKNGEELRSYAERYTAADAAIAPGEKRIDSQTGCRWKNDGTLDGLSVGSLSVKTESEMPLVHLPQAGEYLYQAMGNERLANIKTDMPAKMIVGIDQGGYLREAVFETPEDLARAIPLFCDIRIDSQVDEWVTDNYNYINFEWADGTSFGISLNLRNLEFPAYDTSYMYKLENLGELWSLAESRAQEVMLRGGEG